VERVDRESEQVIKSREWDAHAGGTRGSSASLPALKPLSHIVISSEVGWRKPAPEFFEAVCRCVGRLPNQIVFIGDDRANDYDGARAVGLQALLFDPKEQESAQASDTLSRRCS
jgi:FMN phosphatase YigB (HAD superfamily)